MTGRPKLRCQRTALRRYTRTLANRMASISQPTVSSVLSASSCRRIGLNHAILHGRVAHPVLWPSTSRLYRTIELSGCPLHVMNLRLKIAECGPDPGFGGTVVQPSSLSCASSRWSRAFRLFGCSPERMAFGRPCCHIKLSRPDLLTRLYGEILKRLQHSSPLDNKSVHELRTSLGADELTAVLAAAAV